MEVIRMCVACRQRKPQKQLLRLVKLNNEIVVNSKQKLSGRGAYLCSDCINKVNTKHLSKIFKTNVSEENLEKIKEGMIDDKSAK